MRHLLLGPCPGGDDHAFHLPRASRPARPLDFLRMVVDLGAHLNDCPSWRSLVAEAWKMTTEERPARLSGGR